MISDKPMQSRKVEVQSGINVFKLIHLTFLKQP